MNFHGLNQAHNMIAGFHNAGTAHIHFPGCAILSTLQQTWKANTEIGSEGTTYSPIAPIASDLDRGNPQISNRRYVVPLETPMTYTQRDTLSKLLVEKIGISHKNAIVPHAVVIHGLGGTGKSQLALKFAEDHRDKYNPVIWIDATDVEAVQASFERCAEELEIWIDPKETKGSPWTESKAVRAVLGWLRNRKEMDEQWLVVIDNADDFSWGLQKVIPRSKRGCIIITSRDNNSHMLFDRECEQLQVDTMTPSEARTLLLQRLRLDAEPAPQRIRKGCDMVVQRLGCLALAVDHAGAYIGNELDQESALMQYVEDYDKHQDDLLQDESFRGLLPTEKTVWTVWDTTFKKLQKDHAKYLPIDLLAFFARFKGNIVQDRVFHLASLGIAEVDSELEEEHRLPGDLSQFLKVSGTEWDSFWYRESCKILVRYSLLQRVEGGWPGVKMHSLVQWRAMQYKKEEEWEWWHLLFVLAACHYLPQEHENSRFRQHLVAHIPESADAQVIRRKLGEKTELFIQRTFSRTRFIRQEELFHIHKALTDADGRRIAVLVGLGGVGKTQLAATYAEIYKADYSNIFWLDTWTEDSARKSYAEVARQIVRKHLRAITLHNKSDEMGVVKQWLNHSSNVRWLMICDNYGLLDSADIRQFLPDADHGSFIITTRLENVNIGHRILLESLDRLNSLEILSSTSRRESVMDGDIFLRVPAQS